MFSYCSCRVPAPELSRIYEEKLCTSDLIANIVLVSKIKYEIHEILIIILNSKKKSIDIYNKIQKNKMALSYLHFWLRTPSWTATDFANGDRYRIICCKWKYTVFVTLHAMCNEYPSNTKPLGCSWPIVPSFVGQRSSVAASPTLTQWLALRFSQSL